MISFKLTCPKDCHILGCGIEHGKFMPNFLYAQHLQILIYIPEILNVQSLKTNLDGQYHGRVPC